MAKMIQVGEKFVFIETRREVQREVNSLLVSFKLQLIFGQAFTKEAADAQRVFSIVITRPDLWTLYKDSSRDALLTGIYEEMVAYFAAMKAESYEVIAAARATVKFSGLTDYLYGYFNSSDVFKDATLKLIEA
jgi:hypothetical protein